MNSLEIRKKFFDFFIKNSHTQVPSSSLIPAEDPTLLFTNAGMNQFKDVFLGKETRTYKRAVSIQKCIRAGGKHNDLENVGFTKRHLTFFEMMGNFSFGDYFKKEAIFYAWDFITNYLKLDKDKLYVTVYKLDNESYDIWHKEVGLPQDRISKLGEADNFWQMGDTGPCGPCSEIYIDRGLTFGCKSRDCAPGCSCDRFLEFWNLVFMQYDRQIDGTDKLLKQTGVDTGMGFERLCAILQNKDSVFEIDVFEPLIKKIEELTGINYKSADASKQAAFKVIIDHVRSSCFAIADGCTPSNEGRGYVLRKIIRRAALFAQKLSENNIFADLAPALINQMSPIYPELKTSSEFIVSLLKSEIEKFSANLINGQNILEKYFIEQVKSKIISGAQAFKLYDTYGFPLELTKVIAQEKGFAVDIEEFEKEMEKQRLQSGKKTASAEVVSLDESISTRFTGYDEHVTQSTIIGLIVNNQSVQEVKSGTQCLVITKDSPFYIECGGQISDQGYIKINNKEAKLLGLTKINNAIAANIEAPENLKVGMQVILVVDSPSRINTMKNHTATHLLQAALINILGKQVKQAGSVVTPDYLRFDFTYHETLNPDQIKQVENLVNKKIMENIPLHIQTSTLKEAQSRGVIAFFGEKYNPEKVRVVEVPGFSAELCGGTHVQATGDIGVFKITEVSALSAGVRRLVAVTGPGAVDLFQESFATVKNLSQEFKVPVQDVYNAIEKQKEQLKLASTKIKDLKKQIYKIQIPVWQKQIQRIKDIPFLFLAIEDASAEELKDIAINLMRTESGLYFLVGFDKEKSNFLVSLADNLVLSVDLKQFGSWLRTLGLQGGVKETIIQGGAQRIDKDLETQIKNWLNTNIK